MMEVERNRARGKRAGLDSFPFNLAGTQSCSVPAKFPMAPRPFSLAPPAALSAVLRSAPPLRPPPGGEPSGTPPAAPAAAAAAAPRLPKPLEQLQTELHALREEMELMKSQHNKEIKLLMNELDEEKRIRLTLQMEVERIKKHVSKHPDQRSSSK